MCTLLTPERPHLPRQEADPITAVGSSMSERMKCSSSRTSSAPHRATAAQIARAASRVSACPSHRDDDSCRAAERRGAERVPRALIHHSSPCFCRSPREKPALSGAQPFFGSAFPVYAHVKEKLSSSSSHPQLLLRAQFPSLLPYARPCTSLSRYFLRASSSNAARTYPLMSRARAREFKKRGRRAFFSQA